LTAPPAAAIEVRRLTYADLPQVVAIERRAFTTPWSLAMFVLELSKPSGVCLAAEVEVMPKATGDEPAGRGTTELVGYLVCSRYDLVWHIMNVSVDPDRRRRRIATAMLRELFERVADPDAQFTLEVRRTNRAALELYDRLGFKAAGVRRRYYADNGEDAIVMWRTASTLRGSLDDVPNARGVTP
jgi:[ribosomal protein S18]-alanine N-acetyltransferase